MTVYVDHQKMWADTADEMHAAAERAGIDPKWFNGGPTVLFPCYTVNPTRIKMLIKRGAVEVGRDGAWRWQTIDWYLNGSPVRREIACERIRKYSTRTDLFASLLPASSHMPPVAPLVKSNDSSW